MAPIFEDGNNKKDPPREEDLFETHSLTRLPWRIQTRITFSLKFPKMVSDRSHSKYHNKQQAAAIALSAPADIDDSGPASAHCIDKTVATDIFLSFFASLSLLSRSCYLYHMGVYGSIHFE